MFWARHWFAAILICASALNMHAAEKRWFRARSSHFTVVTDLSEKRAVEFVRRCEQMRAAFGLLMNRATTHDPAPLMIFALNGEREVDELGVPWNQNSKHAGLFLPGADQSYLLVDASADPWHVLFHEYAHELLNANTNASVQTWFEEGFAEYFSTLETNAKTFRIGMVPFAELQFLRENGKLMRFADLVAVRRDSAAYNRSSLVQAMFYAESWLLVHYLFDHQLISRAEPFFAMDEGGRTLADATKDAFGMSPSQLEDELMEYAKGERFRYFSLPIPEGVTRIDVATAGLSMVTARSLLAEMRWHASSRHSKRDAEAYALQSRALLAIEPGNPAAMRSLGIALLEMGKDQEATVAFEVASKAEPKEVMHHYALAVALSAMELDKNQNSAHETSLEQELAACLELDPDFADVYRLQAANLSHRGLLEKAAGAVRKAILLSPRTEAYELALADIELKARDYASALSLLHALKNSRNPDVSRQAEYVLSSEVARAQAGER
jgi:tetratricopeptide (TPR) repeat protein